MKKLLAALLALMMLLGVCACAEGVRFTLRNVRLYPDAPSAAVDLSGLELEVSAAGFAGEAADGGLRLTCSANGRALATVVLATFGDALLAGYGSGGEASALYSASVFTDGAAREAERAAADYARQTEAALADTSFFEAVRQLVPEDWTRDGGAVEYEGESCACTAFEVPQDGIGRVVRAIAANPQFDRIVGRTGNAGAIRSAIEDLAASARCSGALYDGESADYITVALRFDVGDMPVQLDADVRCEDIARGNLLSVMLRLASGDAGISVGFDFEDAVTDDEDWLWRLDAADATKLDAVLAGRENSGPLLDKLQGDAASIFGALAAGVSNVIFTNQLGAAMAGAQ